MCGYRIDTVRTVAIVANEYNLVAIQTAFVGTKVNGGKTEI